MSVRERRCREINKESANVLLVSELREERSVDVNLKGAILGSGRWGGRCHGGRKEGATAQVLPGRSVGLFWERTTFPLSRSGKACQMTRRGWAGATVWFQMACCSCRGSTTLLSEFEKPRWW